jgi:hypothetical protein
MEYNGSKKKKRTKKRKTNFESSPYDVLIWGGPIVMPSAVKGTGRGQPKMTLALPMLITTYPWNLQLH